MAIGGLTEAAILQLIFNATAWAGYADNAAIAPQANIDVALHSGDPGAAGDQTSFEVLYAGYTRMSVPRSIGGWTVSGIGPASCSPVSGIGFPVGGPTSSLIPATNFSVGASGGGPTQILWSGFVAPTIYCGNGVRPQLSTATTITLT